MQGGELYWGEERERVKLEGSITHEYGMRELREKFIKKRKGGRIEPRKTKNATRAFETPAMFGYAY